MKEGGNVRRDTGMAGQKMDGSIINYCLGFLKTSNRVMYGIHYKIIGKCIRRNTTTKGMMFKMMKKGAKTKNAMKAMKNNVECDGIDDTFSDNEDEPLRNRQRMTL